MAFESDALFAEWSAASDDYNKRREYHQLLSAKLGPDNGLVKKSQKKLDEAQAHYEKVCDKLG